MESTCFGGDHIDPFQDRALPALSTAMQNVAEGQDSEESPPALSIWTGEDHDEPFQLIVLPFASTAIQNVADGQEIDVRPFPEGSIDDGDVQVGESEELTASRVCIFAVSGVTVGWVAMAVIATIAQRASVRMVAICSLCVFPLMILATISCRSAGFSGISHS